MFHNTTKTHKVFTPKTKEVCPEEDGIILDYQKSIK